MIFDSLFYRIDTPEERDARAQLYINDPLLWRHANPYDATTTTTAMKISVVSACVEIRSDSIGKMPFFVKNTADRNVDYSHNITKLLSVRPNAIMTPFVFKKLLETWRLLNGNAYVYLARDNRNGRVTDMIPLNPLFVEPELNEKGEVWYRYQNGSVRRLIDSASIVHLKGFSEDGIKGQSVLSRAANKIATMTEQNDYQKMFYQNRAQPSGILTVESDLSKESKDKVRDEWQRIYGGVDNAFRIAVLDHGMNYSPITMTQRDAQFIETTEASVADIARYFLVPLYKLQTGKQTYQSNEQNAIEYVTTAIAPTVKQYEEEFTYKCLFEREINQNMEVVVNLNAEMRGDSATRAEWYRTMKSIGVYSVNDIRTLEDLPNVEGGEIRLVPLNTIPLHMASEYFEHLMENDEISTSGGVTGQTGDDFSGREDE